MLGGDACILNLSKRLERHPNVTSENVETVQIAFFLPGDIFLTVLAGFSRMSFCGFYGSSVCLKKAGSPTNGICNMSMSCVLKKIRTNALL